MTNANPVQPNTPEPSNPPGEPVPTIPDAENTPTGKSSSKKLVIIAVLLFLFVFFPICIALLVVAIIAVNPAGMLEVTPTALPIEIPVITTDTVTPTSTPLLNPQTRTFTSQGGFSFQYPEELHFFEATVRSESPTVSNPGEYQQVHTELADGRYFLSIVYKNATSPVDMEIYGGAAGEFVSRGTVNFLGEPLEKFELVWEDGNNGYYYTKGNTITRGGLTFATSLTAVTHDWEGGVPPEIVNEVDKILESFVFD